MPEVPLRIRKLWDDLQSSLWFRPALWVVALSSLALLLVSADRSVSQRAIPLALPWLFTGGPDAARTMLGSVGATMLTVTTLAFSIIMLAVVQTANAYSPRILRQYLGDTVHQHVLGILIGTFLFSLLVLRTVRSEENATFVPALAITAAILLSLLAIAGFIYFINHVAHSIEVRHIVTLILAESEELLTDLFPAGLGRPWQAERPPALPDGPPAIVHATGSGYIQFVEPDESLAAATRAGVVVRLERTPGEYVLAGTPLAHVWPAAALDQALTTRIQHTFQLGTERTLVQDLPFGVRQLSDIALRAISPAVNDPSTAVNCIDALATLLIKLVRRDPISPYRCDADGNLRVIAYGPTFEAMLNLAFNQIRQYGAGDFAVTSRLIEVCGDIGYVATRPAEQAALRQQVAALARSAERRFAEPIDRAAINARILATAGRLSLDARPLLLDEHAPELAEMT